MHEAHYRGWVAMLAGEEPAMTVERQVAPSYLDAVGSLVARIDAQRLAEHYAVMTLD